MVEKSIFLDSRHSPLIELTKTEVRIILYWLELQANGYWKEGGASRGYGDIEKIYNELHKLVGNRKTQTKRWRWFKEPKSRILRQREYNKRSREKKKLKSLRGGEGK